ncbi:MAG: EamA family transporter RarD [Acidimicrobiales bacterium]
MSEDRRGIVLGVFAYLCWGLFPLYWPLLVPATPVEILAHRIVWTALFVALVLAVRRRWAWLGQLRGDRRRLTVLAVAATVIALNWGVYIWAVNAGHVVEAALGYFVNPLVTVLMGVVILGERLRRAQWVAVAIASVAVTVLTVAYGRPPWIALTLALSFATYGLMKNRVRMPALESLSVETALLFVPATALLLVFQGRGTLVFGHAQVRVTVLLALAGVVTAIPLLLFGAAASRVPLSTMGLLQYLTPVMQFLLGVLVFHEAMPTARWVGFALVWGALAVFSADTFRTSRSGRRGVEVGTGPSLVPETH